jgi:hypothetical protein
MLNKLDEMRTELETLLEQLKEETNLHPKKIIPLYVFEYARRTKIQGIKEFLEREPTRILELVTYIYPFILQHSFVGGPGALMGKFLDLKSSFYAEEEIEEVSTRCRYLLLTNSFPKPKQKVEDGLLICDIKDLENPFRYGAVHPSEKIGKVMAIDKYCKNIPNASFCTLRKIYGINKVHKFTLDDLFNFTYNKLKEKIENYDKISDIIYKRFGPLVTEFSEALLKELEKWIPKYMKPERGLYV